MSKIFVSVTGGCVNNVVSSNKKDTVELWDWDNIKQEDWDIEDLEREWDEIVKKNHIIL